VGDIESFGTWVIVLEIVIYTLGSPQYQIPNTQYPAFAEAMAGEANILISQYLIPYSLLNQGFINYLLGISS